MTVPEDLAAVYARVPRMRCKGLCGGACGPIGCSAREADAMLADGIIPPRTRTHPKLGTMMCSHLTDEGRCAIYAHRPMICRVWGATHALQCEHGCKPEGDLLTFEQVGELIVAVSDDRPDHHAAPEMREAIRAEGPPPGLMRWL